VEVSRLHDSPNSPPLSVSRRCHFRPRRRCSFSEPTYRDGRPAVIPPHSLSFREHDQRLSLLQEMSARLLISDLIRRFVSSLCDFAARRLFPHASSRPWPFPAETRSFPSLVKQLRDLRLLSLGSSIQTQNLSTRTSFLPPPVLTFREAKSVCSEALIRLLASLYVQAPTCMISPVWFFPVQLVVGFLAARVRPFHPDPSVRRCFLR